MMTAKKLVPELRTLLRQWFDRALDEEVVYRRAEVLVERLDDDPEYPESDHRSIAKEVLLQLDSLNYQWITRDDVPAMLKFLRTPRGKEKQGWEEWSRYWDTVDYEKRKQELSSNPFYCT